MCPFPPTSTSNPHAKLIIKWKQSHSLWYTSSRNPLASAPPYAPDGYPTSQQHQQQHQQPQDGPGGVSPNGANGYHHRRGAHLLERTQLARLRADELNMERRRQNVVNFGSTWLKPPGVSKTLHQLREERREVEEHQEAMRREQLAQELAEAEAAGAGGVDGGLNAPEGGDEDGVMDDVQLDGARDLDEDIPEADAADFGMGSDEDDEEEDEDSDEDEDEDEEEDDGPEQRAERTQRELMAQRMRAADDAFRESLARGPDGPSYYGADDEVDEEHQAQMIQEDDVVGHGDDGDGGLDMDADLDDDIPEAEDDGYEHTDSEDDVTSSEADQGELSFAARPSQPSQPQLHPQHRYRSSLARSDATRNSLAISDILSHDESSMLESSPELHRQNRHHGHGHARRGR